jgi:hypothetical protein
MNASSNLGRLDTSLMHVIHILRCSLVPPLALTPLLPML